MTFRTFNRIDKETRIIEYIAQNLSHQNREEAKVLFPDIPIRQLLDMQTSLTKRGFVIYSMKGNPCGIGGIFHTGTIWFVVTEDAKKELCISWFKQARRWLIEQHESYHRIEGYCWIQNTLSQEWMRFMGFDFASEDSAATKEINGEKFLYFMRTEPHYRKEVEACVGKPQSASQAQ